MIICGRFFRDKSFRENRNLFKNVTKTFHFRQIFKKSVNFNFKNYHDDDHFSHSIRLFVDTHKNSDFSSNKSFLT